jgi:uncharacterized protein involved in exopolysaccharide biosynthesis
VRTPKDVSVLQLLAEVLRRWRLVVGLPLATGVVALAVSLTLPKKYTASSSFTPASRAGRAGGLLPSALGGLAGQLIAGLGGDAGEAPRFYADVLTSRTVLEGLLVTPYPNAGSGSGGTMLTALVKVRGKTWADSLADGVQKVRGVIRTSVDITTNVVGVSVTATTPELAAAAANRLVALLNQFNAERRQSRGRERRQFTEGRVAASAADLHDAEAAVRAFLEGNRSYQASPQLMFEYQGRQRRLNTAQELYLTLLREYETARIEEVNDTPVLTVIDIAVPPRKKSRPRRAVIVGVATVVATAAAVLLAMMANYLEEAAKSGASDYVNLRASWAAVQSDVTGLLGRRRGPLG